MNIFEKDIDSRPYTGKKQVSGKVQARVKTSEEASWLDPYFNGTPNYDQVTGVTRGKMYDVVCVEVLGDVMDVTIIDDFGNNQRLGSFFFAEVD